MCYNSLEIFYKYIVVLLESLCIESVYVNKQWSQSNLSEG